MEHVDVLIVGAGLSGIGAAYHLRTRCPSKSYAILEARGAMGGTWDLFRYPGIRSDSDMYTLGYSFKPWKNAKAIADGPSIRAYINETAAENGIDKRIRYHHAVKRASWSSSAAQWTVEAECEGQIKRFSCNFLWMCSGYYKYAAGHTPTFVGTEKFQGRIVHAQLWRDDIDYRDKRVVVIGSGATAVTLVPAMAETAAHVTMLQRSPTYVISVPGKDAIANGLRRVLPLKWAYGITRWKNILFGMAFYKLSKGAPNFMKRLLLRGVRNALPNVDVERHFTPKYNPWDQRLCLMPDGDLYQAMNSGKASVVTGTIESFTEQGVKLQSGQELPADLIVLATGLELEVVGGLQVSVDGQRVDFSRTYNYKGTMFSDVPNFASVFGYTNASWTLKADLIARYVCRLLNYMDAHGARQCTPRNRDPSLTPQPFVDFSSGYVQRALDRFPKQGDKSPWRLYQNYVLDIFTLKYGSIDDGVMEFAAPASGAGELKHAAG